MANAARLAGLCAAAALAVGLSACASPHDEGPGPTQSLAAQLNDLRNAYLNGSMSREEYERRRSNLTHQ